MKISYEFYPPKDSNYNKVVEEFLLLEKYNPRFISITYGAMGGSQDRSIDLIKTFKEKTEIDIVAHLTMVGKSKTDLIKIINDFKSLGINKIVALRGDSPEGKFKAHPDGFFNTSDFVKFLSDLNIETFVSAYPEPHPDSKDFDFDIKLLNEKTNAGANQSITQFCFSNSNFQRLINEITIKKIKNEITAGIMPIYNIKSLANMAARCGIDIPQSIIGQFSGNKKDDKKISIEICLKQINDLKGLGINNFHFYTLNQSYLLLEILENL